MNFLNSRFVFDVDNTLVVNWKGWDAMFEKLSRRCFGEPFFMTRKPDGTLDHEFSKKTCIEILRERLRQIDLPANLMSEIDFLTEVDDIGSRLNYRELAAPFPEVDAFLEEAREMSNRELILLTYGPIGMQTKALEDVGLIDYFDINASFFGVRDKESVLDLILERDKPEVLIYTGDAPNDMRAVRPYLSSGPTRLAVGITAAGLSTPMELRSAGAICVLENYSEAERRKFHSAMTL